MSDKFACDTSVIFNGQILNLIEDGELGEKPEIFISNIVVAEIEYRTNIQKEIGFYGLNVLKQLREWHEKGEIILNIVGNRPTREEIKMSPGGELDALIRKAALENSAILITADRIQGDVGIFEGLEVMFAWEKKKPKTREALSLKLFEYFDKSTMSVHLKRNLPPYAKRGGPGDWHLEVISNEVIDTSLIEDIALEIIENVRESIDLSNSNIKLIFRESGVFHGSVDDSIIKEIYKFTLKNLENFERTIININNKFYEIEKIPFDGIEIYGLRIHEHA